MMRMGCSRTTLSLCFASYDIGLFARFRKSSKAVASMPTDGSRRRAHNMLSRRNGYGNR